MGVCKPPSNHQVTTVPLGISSIHNSRLQHKIREYKGSRYAMSASMIYMMKRSISHHATASIKDKKCPNCFKLYDVNRINEYLKKRIRCYKNIHSTQETYSSSNMSSQSYKGGFYHHQYSGKGSNPRSPRSTPSDSNRRQTNNAKLISVRILQKHILYVIGLSPSIAKEETLRRYEYFGQYGRIQQITINKENAFQSDNQGICYSAFITYSDPAEASIAILSVDQFVYESRLIRASFGRTKYCKFFLKEAQCLNKDCPYQHTFCDDSEIIVKDNVQKKQFFQKCQQLALQLSGINQMDTEQFKVQMKKFREMQYPSQQTYHAKFPNPESIYEKKSLFKIFAQMTKTEASETKEEDLVQGIRVVNRRTVPETQQDSYRIPECKERTMSLQTPKASEQKMKQSSENQSSLTLDNDHSVSEKLRLLQTPQSCVRSMKDNQELMQLQKRNNSSDERTKTQEKTQRVQDFELKLANQLKKQLGPFDSQNHQNMDTYTEKTTSIFDEKKASRFLLSLRDEEEDDLDLRDNMLMSRRSSICKKGSMQSLIVESLKFLNDDTDVVPNKREPLLSSQQFRTSPPSEILNLATPAQSQIGGYDDDQYWNNTILSQQEMMSYQTKMGWPGDDYSFYSHSGYQNSNYQQNKIAYDLRASVLTSQGFTPNPIITNQGLNDSNYQKMSSASKQYYHNQALLSSSGFTQGQNFSMTQYTGRKTTLLQNPMTSSSMIGDSKVPQMIRSPSQPNYDTPGRQAQTASLQKGAYMPLQSQNQNQSRVGHTGDHSVTQKTSNHNITTASMNENLSNRIHSTSFDKQSFVLNQQNLDLFDKYNETSKDLLYAKIFLQDSNASQNQFISSQSLFCYNSQLDDDCLDTNSNKRFCKYSDIGGQVPWTPIKGKMNWIKFTEDDDSCHVSHCEGIEKNSEPKNYYQEFLNLKDNPIFSNHLMNKRRNSLGQDREKLQPQHLQFSSPSLKQQKEMGKAGEINDAAPQQHTSQSKSKKRKATAMTAFTVEDQRD